MYGWTVGWVDGWMDRERERERVIDRSIERYDIFLSQDLDGLEINNFKITILTTRKFKNMLLR